MCAIINKAADARGHYTIGKEMVDNVVEKIRKVRHAVELCHAQV
jgi:uncharacterized protein YlzI (FlbEa/FlbD family)